MKLPTAFLQSRIAQACLTLVAIIWLAAVYSLVNGPVAHLSPALNLYLVQPLLWLSLAGVCYLGWMELAERPKLNRMLALAAFLTGLLQMAVLFVAGVFTGFGNSLYGSKITTMLGNLVYLSAMLLGWEMARAYLGARLSKASPFLALFLLALIFTLIDLPQAQFSTLASPGSLFNFMGKLGLPTFAEHLLATFLALLGGPLVSLAYRAALLLVEWYAPVLPRLGWMIQAFLGTIFPVLAMLVIQRYYGGAGETKDTGAPAGGIPAAGKGSKANQEKGASTTAWIVSILICVAVIWFNTGMFGLRPFLVSGTSMIPTLYAGDVVITRPVEASQVKVGDLVRFTQNNLNIMHRVMEIQQTEKGIIFITRGDNNDVNDPPVTAAMLEGKSVVILPKIGWVGIIVRNTIAWVASLFA
ncbi:MAG TPA: signal peptidase I [Anaerolineaceae bacterium]